MYTDHFQTDIGASSGGRAISMKSRKGETGLNEAMPEKVELDDAMREHINGGNSWQLPDNKVAYEDGKGHVLVLDPSTREIVVFPNRDEYYKVYE